MRHSFQIIWYLFLLVSLNLRAQVNSSLDENESSITKVSRLQTKHATTVTEKALRIGDRVPDFTMSKVFNHPDGKVQFSSFRGKLLILDFWNRGCGPCIASFPKMETLQEQFKDKIQILSVNVYDTHERLNLNEPGFPQASKSSFIRNAKLPMVFNSQEMVDYFPHLGEPYLVLIGPDGHVIAMTDGSAVNASTIRSVLSGERVEFPLANSFRRILSGIDIRKPILGNVKLIDKILYLKRSEQDMEKYLLVAKLGIILNPMSRTIVDTIHNRPVRVGYRHQVTLMQMYKNAYEFKGHRQFVVVESDHPQRYYFLGGGLDIQKWANDNTYTVECISGLEDRHNSLENMMLKHALSACFPDINAYKVRRTIRCMILYRTSSEDKLKTQFPEEHNHPKENRSAAAFSVRNYSFESFVSFLQRENIYANCHLAVPIIDETGYKGRIDINIHKPGDLAGLKSQLLAYGLGLKEEKREIEVLVISDQASTTSTYSSLLKHP